LGPYTIKNQSFDIAAFILGKVGGHEKIYTPNYMGGEKGGDCLQCRIIGTATFSGVSAYAYFLRATTPKADRGHRLFLACFSVGAAAVAVHRAFFV